MTATPQLSSVEQAFRALCLGIAVMVIAPMAAYLVALQIVTAMGSCHLPVDCSYDANQIALHVAIPGFVAGVALSVLLDWRRFRARG